MLETLVAAVKNSPGICAPLWYIVRNSLSRTNSAYLCKIETCLNYKLIPALKFRL